MNLLTGLYQLVTSPSGIFGLLCLLCLTVLSWHLHDSMVMAWAAFFGIVPTALGYFEHKETLQQMQQTNTTVVVDNAKGRL